MSPRFVLGQENVPCVAEVVNRSLKADCTDFTPYAEKELCVSRFLANLLVFYIVDGFKGDLIICFNVLTLLCKIHAALN